MDQSRPLHNTPELGWKTEQQSNWLRPMHLRQSSTPLIKGMPPGIGKVVVCVSIEFLIGRIKSVHPTMRDCEPSHGNLDLRDMKRTFVHIDSPIRPQVNAPDGMM